MEDPFWAEWDTVSANFTQRLLSMEQVFYTKNYRISNHLSVKMLINLITRIKKTHHGKIS